MNAETNPNYFCRICQSPLSIGVDGESSQCVRCGREWPIRGHLCPACGHYEAVDSVACGVCGTGLSRVCPECHTTNWAGNDHCRGCQRPLSLIEILQLTHARATSERLADQMADASRIRAVEERDSARRMAELEALEVERKAALRAYETNKHARERRLLLTAVALAAVVLTALLVYGLVLGG